MDTRAILSIPHANMLYTSGISYWMRSFENACLRRPTEVILPGVAYGGPTFDSSVYGPPRHLKPGNKLPDWIRQARELFGPDGAIWVSITPTFEFLRLESLMIKNQYGVRSDDQVCLVNDVLRRVVERLLADIGDMGGVSGVCVDCCDIYPNSSSNTTEGISNNCFCEDCLRELALEGWSHGAAPFIGASNITRLILRQSERGQGAEHIDPECEWIRDQNVPALLQMSEARGFVTVEDASREEAEQLLAYIRARARVTAKALRNLTLPARGAGMRVAVLLGEQNFDASQGADLLSMVQCESADEYWVPWVSKGIVDETGVSISAFLYGRGPYFVNSLFELIHSADQTIATVGVEAFIQLLIDRTGKVGRLNNLNPGSAFAVELADEYRGFVGVPMGSDDLVSLVEQLSGGTLGQIVPAQVIQQIVKSVNMAVAEERPDPNQLTHRIDSSTKQEF